MNHNKPAPNPTATRAMFAFRIAAVFMTLCMGLFGAAASAAESDTLEWIDDYQQALTLAQETGMPLLVEFRCAP